MTFTELFYLCFFEHPVYVRNRAWTAQSERAVQDGHFQLYRLAKTQKMTKLQNFHGIYKKSNISKTVKFTEILQESKNVQNNFLYPVDEQLAEREFCFHSVYAHLELGKRGYNWQTVSFQLNCFSFRFLNTLYMLNRVAISTR